MSRQWGSDQRSLPNFGNQSAYSPGASETSRMDGPPQPMEVDVNSSHGFPNIPPSDLLAGISTLEPSRTAHSFMDHSSRMTGQIPPLSQVQALFPRPDDPWVGIAPSGSGVPTSRDKSGGAGLRSIGSHISYMNYRVPPPASSECETTIHGGMLPSDSGYASAPRQSVGGSVYGESDRNGDTQNIMYQLQDFQLQNISPEMSPSGGTSGTRNIWEHNPGMAPSGTTHDMRNIRLGGSNSKANKLICPDCLAPVRTKSEIHKHRQRHTKPYICKVDGCTRQGGFSTQNDLDRHTRSCHPSVEAAGNKYSCPFGPCKNKDKEWPRADNFRQHLSRMHKKKYSKDDDLDEFVVRKRQVPKNNPPVQVPPGSLYMDTAPPDNGYFQSSWLMDPNKDADHDEEEEDSRLGDSDAHFDQFAPGDGRSGDLEDEARLEQLISGIGQTTEASGRSDLQELAAQGPCIEPGFLLDANSHQDQAQHSTHQVDAMPQGASRPVTSIREACQNSDATGDISITDDGRENSLPEREATPEPPDAPGDDLLSSPEPQASTNPGKDPLPRQFNQTLARDNQKSGVNSSKALVDVLKGLHESGMLENLLQESGVLRELLDKPGTQRPRPSATASTKAKTTSAAVAENHKCSGCPKIFARLCELKKHMKRHEKPYGCTFPQCHKRFGSKNDWKRHENSQHLQHEVWKCNEKSMDGPGGLCSRVCPRRETFRAHLEKTHGIKEASAVDDKCEKARIGRGGDSRFWCGFCEKIIEIAEKGGVAWIERFNHIDDHVSGKNGVAKRDFSEWKHVDPGLPEIDFSSQASDSPASQVGGSASANDDGLKKRVRDGEGAPAPSKKAKVDAQNAIWYCCQCANYWQFASTAQCMESDCGHSRCNDCTVGRQRSKET